MPLPGARPGRAEHQHSSAARPNVPRMAELAMFRQAHVARVMRPARQASTGSVAGTSLRAFLGNLDCLWKRVPMREREGQWRVPEVGGQ